MTCPRAAGIAVTVALLAGCAALVGERSAMGNVGPAPFDECQPPYAFAGDSTMAALGLTGIGGLHEAERPGRIWITRDSVAHEDFAPPGAPGGIPEGQVVCVEWPDGSGMSAMLPEPWAPAGGAGIPVDAAPGPSPLAPLLIGAVVLGTVAVSVVAFRRAGSPPSR